MKKIILATLGLGLLAVGVNANAVSTGQGGVAGSAVMRLTTTSVVTHVSSSIAIGKQSAYTGGLGGKGVTTKGVTFAAGASGQINMAIDGSVTKLDADPSLATAQVNGFDKGSIQLDTKLGTYKGNVSN